LRQAAVPYLFGTVAMILWARHSDATTRTRAHVGLPLLLTAAAQPFPMSSRPSPRRPGGRDPSDINAHEMMISDEY